MSSTRSRHPPKALVFSLAARVAARFRQGNGSDFDPIRLDEAEQRCWTARTLLSGHDTHHRYWGVVERSFAMVYTARATQALPHERGIVLMRAMKHACDALKCLTTVYGARNVNVAMTLEVIGEIAAIAVNIPEQDCHRRAVVDRLTQKCLGIAPDQPRCSAPTESARDLSRFFYEHSMRVYRHCNRRHPACTSILSALRQL